MGQIKERRQVHELPVLRLMVTEHHGKVLTCPVCQHQTVGRFPRGVQAPAHYGPGAHRLSKAERDALVLQYFAILQQGFAFYRMYAPPPEAPVRQKPGRRKQDDAKNLWGVLLARAEQVLAFLDDLTIPFSNNQVERDLRMVKVQQKSLGLFAVLKKPRRSHVIHSYLSTLLKQGCRLLAAMTVVFEGPRFPLLASQEHEE